MVLREYTIISLKWKGSVYYPLVCNYAQVFATENVSWASVAKN